MTEFLGTADRMDLFQLDQNQNQDGGWPPSAILKISNDTISGRGRPINFVFDSTEWAIKNRPPYMSAICFPRVMYI